MGEMGEALNAIPKAQGELKDAAIRLADYVKNPREEAQAVRGLLFAQYLGGSVASAMVNMTQPFAVSFPYLTQFTSVKDSAAQLGRAAKELAQRNPKYDPELTAALHRAVEDGVVAPQEIHQLMAQARGSGTLSIGDGTKTGEAAAAAKNAVSKLASATTINCQPELAADNASNNAWLDDVTIPNISNALTISLSVQLSGTTDTVIEDGMLELRANLWFLGVRLFGEFYIKR